MTFPLIISNRRIDKTQVLHFSSKQFQKQINLQVKRNKPDAISPADMTRMGRHRSKCNSKANATINKILLDFAIVKKLTVTYFRPQFDKPKEILI